MIVPTDRSIWLAGTYDCLIGHMSSLLCLDNLVSTMKHILFRFNYMRDATYYLVKPKISVYTLTFLYE